MKRGTPAPRDLAAEINAVQAALKDALREGRPTAAIRATLAELQRLEAAQSEAADQYGLFTDSNHAVADAAERLAANTTRALSDRLAELATPDPPWASADPRTAIEIFQQEKTHDQKHG